MRDYLILLAVFGSLPFILFRPYIGILMWSWIGYMNPHRLTWSFAYEMPLAQIVAITTLIAFLFTRDRGKVPINSTTIIWGFFILWFSLTTLVALDPDAGVSRWEQVAKIQLFALLTMILIRHKHQIDALVAVIAASVGFFGLKGGIFTLTTGGGSRVYGPPDSFIEDNNALALALIMVLPLMWYLVGQLPKRWQKSIVLATMAFSFVSILGSHSRGALLAGVAMTFFLMVKSRAIIRFGIVAMVAIPLALSVMPREWFDRMETIGSYEQDNSAMGRLTAWQFATDLAVQRPIGGGFDAFTKKNYRAYSPEISAIIDERDGRYQGPHSIYFRVLGEHGFLGLALFLGLGLSAYRRARATGVLAKQKEDMEWTADLSRMLQVSMIGYAVGGAFLGLSYFDLFYHLVALTVITHNVSNTSQLISDSVASTDSAGREFSNNGQSQTTSPT